MCTPYVTAALAIGSSLSGIKSQNQQLTSQAQQVASAAQRQTASDIALWQTRGYQEGAKITLEQVRRFRQGIRERGTLAARLGDAGVAGGTTVRDAVSSVIQEEMDVGTLEVRKDWTLNQIQMEQRAAIVAGQSQLNKAQSMLESRTGTGPGVLQLIGAGISGYSQGRMLMSTRTDFNPSRDTPAQGG